MNNEISRKSRRNDRIAEWLIKVGGLLVIISVIWILVMIAKVSLPLFFSPKASVSASFSLPAGLQQSRLLAGGVDDAGVKAFVIDENGNVHFFDAAAGQTIESLPVPEKPRGSRKIANLEATGKSSYNLVWDNGAASSLKVSFGSAREGARAGDVEHSLSVNEQLAFGPAGPTLQTFVRQVNDRDAVRVDQMESNRFRITHRTVEKDLMENEAVKVTSAEISDKPPAPVTAITLDGKGHYLYAGTHNGQIMRWDISEPGNPRLIETVNATSGASITALAVVLGDYSLAVASADGGYNIWFPVNTPGSGTDKRLTLIHRLPGQAAATNAIIPSNRDKSLASFNSKGELRIDHTTSERMLLSLNTGKAAIRHAAYSPRCTAIAALDADNRMTVWKLKIPHPEISLGTLLGKVWYEGYDKPEYVWQSSSASDDFEPKKSLMPLIIGTIKATAFAMIFAVPLALLGALYTSQFMTLKVKNRVKPTVEIMAAIPSVVIGFLAGLWLAPLIDKAVLALFISLVVIPALLLTVTLLWRQIRPYSKSGIMLRGNEFMVMAPVIVAGVYISWLLGGAVEASMFGGDFKQWLYSVLGVNYDQRNALVIAIALGFAVIPIIFTIAEDALSNVPRNLSAASMALGASRWQTAWRVILPSAMPGVFSAIMIGFGRAIGETMIVLMATGNTPIMSWSAFNGLRSLSANIAVEIPEAPLFGSLYRVLFLSAVLLFIFTFIINTAAEALRQRFRKKYGRY